MQMGDYSDKSNLSGTTLHACQAWGCPSFLSNSADTLEVLDELSFTACPADDVQWRIVYPGGRPVFWFHPLQCNLSSFTALRSLSIAVNHQVDLRVPPTLERLSLHLVQGDKVRLHQRLLEMQPKWLRWRDSDLKEATHQVHSRLRGSYWGGLLRGATGLRSLEVEGDLLLWNPDWHAESG